MCAITLTSIKETMKKIKQITTVRNIILLFVAAVVVFVVLKSFKAATNPLQVEMAVSTRGNAQEIVSVSGFLKAGTKADLSFGVTTSKVVGVYSHVGDTVAPGTALLALDSSTLADEVAAAEAALSQARNTYFSTKSTQTVTDETYKDSGDLNSPKVKALIDQAFQNSRAADDAQSRAEAALNEAKANLAKSVLTSPIAGTVSLVNANIGEIPTGVVAEVVDLNTLYFDVLVDELDIGSIKLGQLVTIKLDSAKNVEMSGVISEISPVTIKDASNNVTVEVKVTIQDSKGVVLRPGLEGDSQIIVNQHVNTVLVPFEAVVAEGDQSYVWEIKNGKAVKQPVSTGLEGDLNTEITSGLSENETVILNPAKTLTNGQSVVSK